MDVKTCAHTHTRTRTHAQKHTHADTHLHLRAYTCMACTGLKTTVWCQRHGCCRSAIHLLPVKPGKHLSGVLQGVLQRRSQQWWFQSEGGLQEVEECECHKIESLLTRLNGLGLLEATACWVRCPYWCLGAITGCEEVFFLLALHWCKVHWSTAFFYCVATFFSYPLTTPLTLNSPRSQTALSFRSVTTRTCTTLPAKPACSRWKTRWHSTMSYRTPCSGTQCIWVVYLALFVFGFRIVSFWFGPLFFGTRLSFFVTSLSEKYCEQFCTCAQL